MFARELFAELLNLLLRFMIGHGGIAREAVDEGFDLAADVIQKCADRLMVAPFRITKQSIDLMRELPHVRHCHDLFHRHCIGLKCTFGAPEVARYLTALPAQFYEP